MRKILSIFFLSLSSLVSAVTYYVSSSGDDAASGISETTAWRTITRVNSAFSVIKPGDRILFRRGDTFYGQLKIIKSGTSVSPIFFGAYGSGNKPVITGFTTLTGWTFESNGIFSKTVSCETPPEMVIINEVQYGMGRHPNSTWLAVDSHSGDLSISDDYLNSNTANWTGAEIVQRKQCLFVIDRYKIINHTDQTIEYNGSGKYPPGNGYGYFIQNDIRTLDAFGEWYYNPGTSTFYMYFGLNNPNDNNIQVSTIDDLVIFQTSINYIVFDNIVFKGANNRTFYLYRNNYITIQNCDVLFTGDYGIRIYVSDYTTVSNTAIYNSNNCGIYLSSGSDYLTVENCIINYTGMIPGLGSFNSQSGHGIISSQGTNFTIRDNKIFNCGSGGINIGGDNSVVSNNFINNFSLIKDDNGGIYYGSRDEGHNITISGNIILNGKGGKGGKPATVPPMAAGIYLDYYSTGGFEIISNTVAHCPWIGFLISGSQNVKITGNTSFNANHCIRIQELAGLGSPPRNITMSDNIFFGLEIKQTPIFVHSTTNDFDYFGTFDYNYYARPVDNAKPVHPSINWSGLPKSLPEWQNFYGHDMNSKISPITLTDTSDIDFYYNETKTDKVIPLNEPMIDVKGNKYVNSITLTPFTSTILMVDPNPSAPVVPVYQSSVIENLSPSVLTISYHVKLANSVPSPSAFTVTVNGSNMNITAVAISGNTVILNLAGPVEFGDIITVSYTKPATVPFIQSLTGGAAVSLTNQAVTNNLIDPSVPNDPPVPVIYSENSYYSGFVGEIDASGSYDLNGDSLDYDWIIPAEIPVSSTDSSKIRFLAPILAQSATFDFVLNINDGKAVRSQTVQVPVLPYKPGLPTSRTSIIEASEYNAPDYPANIADGNLDTKWSVNGDNQWLLFTLAQPFKISHIQLGLIPEQRYESFFDIYVSKDNVKWDPAITGQASCYFSGRLQIYDLPPDKTLTDYSFVKLIGHGSALDTWNNYSELWVFGNPGDNSGGPGTRGNVLIHPNPAKDFINVLILEPPVESQLLKIFNSKGALCFEYLLDAGIYNAQIPLNLCAGIYVAQVLLGSVVVSAQVLLIAE